jgi:hypothetical protein
VEVLNNAALKGRLQRAALNTVGLMSAGALTLACASQPCTPPECDIRLANCQRRIMNATACDRGVPPRDVPTRVLALEDYVRQVLEDPDDNTRFTQQATALALLGLQEPGDAEDILGAFYATVGAFYDRQADEITVLERGEPLDSPGYSVLMVHEFAHALQRDVSTQSAPTLYTLDRWLARSAIFEGDATLTTDRAAVRLFGADPDEVNWNRVYRPWADTQRAHLVDEPYRVSLANRYFPYAFGSVFLEPVRRGTGQASIDRWLANPPDSTRAIMAGTQRAHAADDFEANAFDTDALRPPADASALDAAATAAFTELVRLDAGVQDASADAATVIDDAAAVLGDAAVTEDAAVTHDADSPPADAGDAGVAEAIDPLLLVPALPDHRLLYVEALGQFVFEAFAESVARRLSPQSALAKKLRRSGAKLRADHLSLWVNDATEAPAAVYRLRFADDTMRDAWLAVSQQLQLGTHATLAAVHAGDLVIVSSADQDWLSQLDASRLRWRTLGSAEFDEQSAAFRERFTGAHICPRKSAPLGLGEQLLHH